MPLGEAISQDFKIIKNNPTDPTSTLDLPKSTVSDCCFYLPVLAELVVTSEYNNDKSSVIWFYDNGYTGAAMELEQLVSGTWTKIADLIDDTYGTFYDYGFFTNDNTEKAMGYLIDWNLMLVAFGQGKYRVKTVETGILGNTNKYSLEWCLWTHTPDRAEGTVRIDWWLNGILGDSENDRLTRDFGALDWFNEIRLPSAYFGDTTSTYEKEYIRYQNGNQVWIKDERKREYRLEIGRIPNYLHELLSGEVFQADATSLTDFNINNAVQNIDTYIKLSSDYAPRWNTNTKLASVELSFENQYQNFVRKRC
jgi:hypothetical protein